MSKWIRGLSAVQKAALAFVFGILIATGVRVVTADQLAIVPAGRLTSGTPAGANFTQWTINGQPYKGTFTLFDYSGLAAGVPLDSQTPAAASTPVVWTNSNINIGAFALVTGFHLECDFGGLYSTGATPGTIQFLLQWIPLGATGYPTPANGNLSAMVGASATPTAGSNILTFFSPTTAFVPIASSSNLPWKVHGDLHIVNTGPAPAGTAGLQNNQTPNAQAQFVGKMEEQVQIGTPAATWNTPGATPNSQPAIAPAYQIVYQVTPVGGNGFDTTVPGAFRVVGVATNTGTTLTISSGTVKLTSL